MPQTNPNHDPTAWVHSEAARRELERILKEYLEKEHPCCQEELEDIQNYDSFSQMLRHVARAERPNHKRYFHQNRSTHQALGAATRALQSQESTLSKLSTFAEIFEAVERATGQIHGIGPLYIYDTALRIGAFRGCYPEHVYLHAGTAEGAAAMGYSRKDKFIEKSQFPEVWQSLEPYQIEDLLCISKEKLQNAYARFG